MIKQYCKNLVSAIVVTLNKKDSLLKQCIYSLSTQNYPYFEITVVNNGEYNANYLKSEFPCIKIINNVSNLFFSQSQNQGIQVSQGELVLCLNDDVILESNFIDEAVKVINIDERIGMVSGKILRMDKVTIDSCGLFLGKSRKPIERGFNHRDRGQYDKEEHVFGVSGAAAFYRREMLDDIHDEYGYFDERFGMFYEDLDIAWRANRNGWVGYYTPRAVAYHYRGASSKTVIPKIRFLKKYQFACLNDNLKLKLIKNRYRTIIKNDSFWGVILNLPFILAYEFKLYLYLIIFSPKTISRLLIKTDL